MQQETDTNVSTVTMQSSIVRVVGFESSETMSGIVHLYETLTWRSGFGKLHGGNHFSPDSDSYRGSYFQQGGRATNHFGGLDVAPRCHCWVPS